ncbi:hypothetical protein EJ06DRAFT_423093 [Trichodelitschia bisporula]|uniref:Uncharacterized protein n=1 Tax=Trichodelitschia bisporula TaxID=703511 RepID=A0A6G1HW67_9PEZI|nr:hypothetical protein EJ06DRAFT_423093 [Trichodelitschia bisporula]
MEEMEGNGRRSKQNFNRQMPPWPPSDVCLEIPRPSPIAQPWTNLGLPVIGSWSFVRVLGSSPGLAVPRNRRAHFALWSVMTAQATEVPQKYEMDCNACILCNVTRLACPSHHVRRPWISKDRHTQILDVFVREGCNVLGYTDVRGYPFISLKLKCFGSPLHIPTVAQIREIPRIRFSAKRAKRMRPTGDFLEPPQGSGLLVPAQMVKSGNAVRLGKWDVAY